MSSIKYTNESLEKMLDAPNDRELASAIRKELDYLVVQYRTSRQREFLLKQTTYIILSMCRAEGFKPTEINEEPF